MSLGRKLAPETLEQYTLNNLNHEKNPVQMGYYGTSCFTISYKGSTYLADPFFSNPNFFDLMVGKYKSEDYLIEPFLKQIPHISMVSISHGHYDHCLNLLSFKEKYNKNTAFIASESVFNELNSWFKDTPQNNIHALTKDEIPKWITSQDGVFRVLPIRSIHQAHLGKNIRLFAGDYQLPTAKIPKTVWQWKEGETYSYLVDVLDQGQVIKRIFIVAGELPKSSLEYVAQITRNQPINFMLTPFWHKEKSGNAFITAYNYLHPQKVIFHHWNDFFRSPEKSLKVISYSDLDSELKAYRQENLPIWILSPFSFTNI